MESLDRRKQEENQRHHWGGAAVSQLRDAGDLDQGDCIHWGKWKHTNSWGFPGGPVVKTVLLIQQVVVWPLIRELRSCMLHGMAKCVCVCVYTHVCAGLVAQLCLFVTSWTIAHQAPLSVEFSRQEHWSGLPFPTPRDLLDPGIEAASPTLAGRASLVAQR